MSAELKKDGTVFGGIIENGNEVKIYKSSKVVNETTVENPIECTEIKEL